ncbi:MAG: pyridoxal-phosphate dependent enzyme [Actinobacteria bacterium]|nr:MAG: pyridoxal-phosphate dependent enzyme [Actinomycetota bacterium]
MTAPTPDGARVRRVPLAHLPTPLEPGDRLGAALGLRPGTLWVKRDDCTGLAGGGNKARKLEYLCAEALDQGCDTLVTGGGRQSNHVRMTAAAANRLGLACTVVLASDPGLRPTGNVVLDHLLGAELVWGGDLDYYGTEAAIDAACERLRGEGRHPYGMPVGGASITGALAYVAAAAELEAQLREAVGTGAAARAVVVVADGSGGTHAGLVAGLGDHGRVLGVDVGTRPDLLEQVPAKAAAVAEAAGLPVPGGGCQIDGDRFGDGYGAPTHACREALDLAARLEGLVLDPVYTGKAMAGLVAAAREHRLDVSAPVVFLHTGGMPALFASRYASWITQRP